MKQGDATLLILLLVFAAGIGLFLLIVHAGEKQKKREIRRIWRDPLDPEKENEE